MPCIQKQHQHWCWILKQHQHWLYTRCQRKMKIESITQSYANQNSINKHSKANLSLYMRTFKQIQMPDGFRCDNSAVRIRVKYSYSNNFQICLCDFCKWFSNADEIQSVQLEPFKNCFQWVNWHLLSLSTSITFTVRYSLWNYAISHLWTAFIIAKFLLYPSSS